jgi:hypothetical protein
LQNKRNCFSPKTKQKTGKKDQRDDEHKSLLRMNLGEDAFRRVSQCTRKPKKTEKKKQRKVNDYKVYLLKHSSERPIN